MTAISCLKKLVKLTIFGIFDELFATQNVNSTVLPDRSLLNGQKLVENAKIEKFECDIMRGQSSSKMPKLVNFGNFLKS